MKKLIPVIAMISVLIMFIWGFLGSFEYSWLAIMAGGTIMTAIHVLNCNHDNIQELE